MNEHMYRKLIKHVKIRHTHGFLYANFKTLELKLIYFQFSLKDPWLLPHYKRKRNGSDFPLTGWLFFYFGIKTEALLCSIDKDDIQSIDKTYTTIDNIPFIPRAYKIINDKNDNLYCIGTMEPTIIHKIIQKYKQSAKRNVHLKTHYNRLNHTITYYTE